MNWVHAYFLFSQKLLDYFLIYKSFVNDHFILACFISILSILPIAFVIIVVYFIHYWFKQKSEEREREKHYKLTGKQPK